MPLSLSLSLSQTFQRFWIDHTSQQKTKNFCLVAKDVWTNLGYFGDAEAKHDNGFAELALVFEIMGARIMILSQYDLAADWSMQHV